jgi:transcriptional regulator with XRE-family HTH domain
MPRSASEKLARIRANLSLSVAELARVLQVERPTIYAWMRDDSVSPRAENRFRLDQLHGLARRWERLSNLPIGKLVREANDAGDSLVSILEAERFEDAAQFLEPIALRAKEGAVRRVPSVRESLERHGLAGRVRASQEEIDRVSR